MNAEYVCDGGEGITRLIAVGRFDEVWLSQGHALIQHLRRDH
jgi:hypothetical protein